MPATPDSQLQPAPPPGPLPDHINENIESIVALQRREWETIDPAQRRLERVSRFAGRPLYLLAVLWLVAAWVLFNSIPALFHARPFDPPPFEALQGLLTLISLLTTTIVLIAQNSLSKMERQRAHLDLQVNLLTEQKVSKLIVLLEELRRDLPGVKDRHDPQAAAMQERADTSEMISALNAVGLTSEKDKPAQ